MCLDLQTPNVIWKDKLVITFDVLVAVYFKEYLISCFPEWLRSWYSDYAVRCTIRVSITGNGKILFSCPKRPDLLFNKAHRFFPWGVKRPECEAPPSAEVKNEYSHTYTPCTCLPGVYRDNFFRRVAENKQKIRDIISNFRPRIKRAGIAQSV